ncbi:MAG: protein kinase [Acidobacteria bacterium]|nr:protein kinase [Acidobacteriota bacterium]
MVDCIQSRLSAAVKVSLSHAQISDLLLDAVEATPEARVALLEDLRARSPQAAVELEKLLGALEQAGDFLLNTPELAIPESSTRALQPGDLLGDRFLVEQFLGSGGFSEVYLVLDGFLHRRVALKTIKPELAAEEQFLQQMKDEIKLAQSVGHPNLCRLYDLERAQVRDSDVVFITMEWISGPTLADYLADHDIAVETAKSIARQVLAGLAELHARHVLHCDLKTSNIMLAPEPDGGTRAVITDFGLARLRPPGNEDTLTLLESGFAMGTPAYMAPEQLRGKAASIASDLHAMGVILFEMRAGRLPFQGDTPFDIAMARLENEAPPVRTLNPTVSKAWERAIACCLDRDPKRRPRSASEVQALLDGKRVMPTRRHAAMGLAAFTAAAALGYAGLTRYRGPREQLLSAAAQRSMQLGAMFLRDRNKQSLVSAVEEYSSVTKAHPNHAPAWAGLAEAYSSLHGFGHMDTRESLRLATEAGKRAIDLDPENAHALTVYARNLSINVRRWLEAESYFQRAMKRNPDDARLINWYAAHLGRLSRFDQAISMLEQALARHPDDLALNQQMATEYFRAQRMEKFEAAARELVRLFYDKPLCRLVLARAFEWAGKFDQAEKEIAEADRLGGQGPSLPQKITLAAARGRLDEARRLARSAALEWDKAGIESMQMAITYVVTGEVDRAIQSLNQGFDREDSSVLYAPTNPYFARIRQHDGFVQFNKRLGL